MANTKLVLDRQASAQTFDFGTTAASGQGLVTINKGTAATSTLVLDVKGTANIAGNLNLIGNLNITGSIDEQTVTNLAVTDLTIRTNKGGTTAGAAGAGLQVEGDTAALIGAISYAAASATKFQIGDGTTQIDIVSTSATQTLTNKTIGVAQLSGQVSISNGGTGASTAATAFNALSPMTTLGDVLYGGTAGAGTRLAGNTTTTRQFLTSVGNGSVSAAPTFSALAAADIPSLAASIITSGILTAAVGGTGNGFTAFTGPATSTKTFTLPNASAAILTDNAAVTVAQGGTGIQTTTAYGVILGGTTATGAFQNAGAGTANQVLTSNGPSAVPTWQAVTASAYFRATAVTGTQDGSNKIFTIANAVSTGSEQVFLNGQLLTPGSTNDYVISSTTVTFQAAMTAPAATDTIRVYGNY